VRESTALELPRVDVVDMRLELHRGNTSLLSLPLQELLASTLRRTEQTILLLNRRGLATVVLCRACGSTLQCPYCDIPLVYHQDRERLLCHRCDYREAPHRACPTCGGPLDYFGAGTQRVEAEARRLFPAARVLRWDQDAVRREGGAGGMLRRVERREVDIVVGTQMVTKGFDLPHVTAIGVINADTGLHLPDFRAGERTFSMLTQVAGRAGRRGPGSRVIVQSYTPEHYAIQAASRHDYDANFAEEIDFRRIHRYPPFVRLARFLYRHKSDEACARAADELARKLARHARERGVAMDLLGPAPAFASRVRGEYQWHVILRAADLEELLTGLPGDPGWVVDIDPQSLL
jgi:primosomal protein N' (replication factor Y)